MAPDLIHLTPLGYQVSARNFAAALKLAPTLGTYPAHCLTTLKRDEHANCHDYQQLDTPGALPKKRVFESPILQIAR